MKKAVKRTLETITISLVGIGFAIYFMGYLYLKLECYSTEFIPSDPWKSSNLTATSRVTYWGTDFTGDLPHRDPGLDFDERFSDFLNAIYWPLRFIDESISGWSVRFRKNWIEHAGDLKPDHAPS
jgi:hypothetical protein